MKGRLTNTADQESDPRWSPDGRRIAFVSSEGNGMEDAQRLYVAFGFRPLTCAMGSTGHFGCDRYYALELGAPHPLPSP